MITEAMDKIKAARLLLEDARDILDAAGVRMITARYDRDDGMSVHLFKGLDAVANTVEVNQFKTRTYRDHPFTERSFGIDGIEYFELEDVKNALSNQ